MASDTLAAGDALSSNDIDEFSARILVLGDTSVGKSCLIHRFCKGSMPRASEATVGVACDVKRIQLGPFAAMRAQLWDIAGSRATQAAMRQFYRGATAAVVVFALDDRRSFEAVHEWVQEVRRHCTNEHLAWALIGNKSDRVADREVTLMEAQDLSDRYRMAYAETSAVDGSNVELVFNRLARKVHELVQSRQLAEADYGVHGVRGSARQVVAEDVEVRCSLFNMCRPVLAAFQ